MNTHVIITKKAGQDIPRGYLQTALKACPTYFGMSLQDKVEDTPVLETSAEHKSIDLDELFKTLAQLKDVPVVLQLGNVSQDFDPESNMMPYTFQIAGAADGDPATDILAVHLEGDFPNYSKVGEGNIDEFNLWDNFIYPLIAEKFEASQDVDDFYRRLRQSSFEQAVMNTVAHRGVAVFVPWEGDLIAFGKNELGAEYDWGTTSNTFGWGTQTKLEEAATKAVQAVKKPLGRLARAMGSTAVAAPEQPKEEPKKEEKKVNPPGVHDIPDPFKDFPGTGSKTHKMTLVPKGLQGNARNRWIRVMLGLGQNADLPKGYDRSGFMLPVALDLVGFAQEDVSTNEDVKRLASRVIRFRTPDAQPVGDQMKEAADQPIIAPDPNQVQRPAQDFLPEVGADETKISTDLVTEWATNPKAPSSLDVQRVESKWPVFTVSRGITLANVARWSIADKKMFCKKCPNDAARLISELMLKLHEYGEFDPQVNTEKVNDQPGHNGTEKKQVEVPPTKPAAAPAKTGRLARAKGLAG